jgi:7-keto-8-aminopelargonate synthetase-like enzyme
MLRNMQEGLDATETTIELTREAGLVHQELSDIELGGREITLSEGRAVHFGNCSYLGLETDARLKAGAHDAIDRYGVVFSSSRTYVRLPLYDELESLLSTMAGGAHAVVAPTTSLAHHAALPILIEDGDAVCFDAFVHASVQSVLPTLIQRGIPCEVLPHNRLDALEQRAKRLAEKHRRVFYLCDGVFGMHGDVAPLGQLFELLDRVPSLFAYVDDAHSVGWAGRHGSGLVLGERRLHPQMAVAWSLSKGFGAGGGAVVVGDEAMARRIRGCGGSLLFSGPVAPAQLGAGLASARIHLSPEIKVLQTRLRERMALFDRLAKEHELGVVESRSPIRFVEIGSNEATARAGHRLLEAGFYLNIAAFPDVPQHHAGLRLMLTCHHTLDDIAELVPALAEVVHHERSRELPKAPARHAEPAELRP